MNTPNLRRTAAGAHVPWALILLVLGLFLAAAAPALAHGVTLGDKGYIQEVTGVKIIPFLYLGAKHMVTGYDHLLFLFGVIFFLYGMKQIGSYVTLFAIGHSTTLLQEVGQAFRENGLTAAITALIGGSLAIAATVTRKAFTNEAMLERLDKELHLERERTDKQRADDRKADADRLERIETDIRAMRDVMFEAFQRGRTD